MRSTSTRTPTTPTVSRAGRARAGEGWRAHEDEGSDERAGGREPYRHCRACKGGKEGHIFVGGGFVEVSDNHVIILSPSAERPEDIDYDRAERAKERAEKRLASRASGEVDVARAEVALRRSVERLKMQKYI